jgi:hypothetical protein
MSEATATATAAAAEQAPVAAETDYRAIYRAMTTPQLVTEAWELQDDPTLRNEIVGLMTERQRTGDAAAWPSAAMAAREEMAGLYPDPEDPMFAARLFSKREFYESRAIAAAAADGTIDPCTSAAAEQVFELTPVQRIVSRFLHPLTPYMGMLIDHGVGVGKTCTAVTIAEQFLEIAPRRKVIVIAPQALQENFRKTVFDPAKLRWDEAEGRWTAQQCTGTSYLERLDLMTNPDLRVVTYKVEEDRRSRYRITGYLELANWIRGELSRALPASLVDPVEREAAENAVLRRLFSDHLIIIDEAHNLRDTSADFEDPTPKEDTKEAAGDGDVEARENAAGKALNPWLKRICLHTEGMRLVLMTATPMYNAAPEICLLLNYLIMNDEKSERLNLDSKKFFTKEGALKPGPYTKNLARMARRYVTYMRGENPFTFPLRMRPLAADDDAVERWPAISASKLPMVMTEEEKAVVRAMPFVFTEPVAGSPPEVMLRDASRRAVQAGLDLEVEGGGDIMLDQRMQMSDICYPNMTMGDAGWNSHFATQIVEEELPPAQLGGKIRVRKTQFFRPTADIDSIFAGEGLRVHAPKMHRIVESVKAAQGICFVYSHYIRAGVLPMAVALERAGFQRRMANGKIVPLLQGIDAPPPVCAICGQVEASAVHGGADHPFRPACYVMLTSEDAISPSFSGLVRQAASWPNDPEWGPLGSNVKVILGSRVASEGLDLKCIREMHIMDAWYHLNRVEQITGRAIRYCSHAALRPLESRRGLPAMVYNNCLIYLHALRVPERDAANPAFETADMYAYRIAIAKALMVGHVQRILKTNAWDCNLELEAIVFAGLPPRRQIDAQGNDRRSLDDAGNQMDGFSINDQDYTTYCDYQACRHACAVAVPRTEAEGLHIDSSTFGVSDARRLVLAKQQYVRALFRDQVVVPERVIQDIFGDLPWEIASEALMELLDGRRFRLRRPDGVEGFLLKKAGYVVFQPAAVTDSDIPMTMRYARAFQLRRRYMQAQLPVLARAEEAPVQPAAPALPPGGGVSSAAAPVAPQAPAAALARWAEWVTFAESGGVAPLPPGAAPLLAFLLRRYAAFDEAKVVTLRYWFDRQPVEVQRALLEAALTAPAGTTDPVLARLQQTLASDLFRSSKTLAYRVFNPDGAKVEVYCRKIEGEPTFTPCAPNMQELVEKTLNTPVVFIPGPKKEPPESPTPYVSVGPLFGFIALKKGAENLVFKTLDTTVARSAGAECGNVSNLHTHRPRIQALQAAAATTDLSALLLPDQEETWDEAGAKARANAPTHLWDLKQQPLCLYMEWLTRIMDARRVSGRRWFLTATGAVAAGIKTAA